MMGFGGTYVGSANQIATGIGVPSLKASTTLGAPATSLTVSGLDLDTDKTYYVEICLKHVDAVAGNISMFCNADTTAGNYLELVSTHASATTTCTGTTSADAILCGGNTILQNQPFYAYLWIRNDYGVNPVALGFGWTSGAANYALQIWWKWSTASTNVTSLTFTDNKASGLGTGSYVNIYRVGA